MKRFYKNVLVVVLDDGGDAFQVFLRVSQSSIKKELYYVGLYGGQDWTARSRLDCFHVWFMPRYGKLIFY